MSLLSSTTLAQSHFSRSFSLLFVLSINCMLALLIICSTIQAVTSLSWQRLKPVIVNESNCTAEVALLGGAIEDSILMPDPLPSVTTSTGPLSATSGSRNPGRSGSTFEASLTETSSSFSTAEETPLRSHLRSGGSLALARLHAPRSSYNFKDDMEVFSPLVDVQPITPSLDKLWDDHNGSKKDNPFDKKPLSMLFPSSSRRFSSIEDGASDHPIFNWKSSSSKQVLLISLTIFYIQ